MCLLILNPKNTIKKSWLAQAWKDNNDGAGMAWPEDGEVKISKYPTDEGFESFYKDYTLVRNRISKPMMLHFRISTSGFEDKYLHPFVVGETDKKVQMVMGHNGIIESLSDFKESDTFLLAEILKCANLTSVSDFSPELVKALEDTIGHSKLAFLDANGGFRLMKAQLGHWNEQTESWFSNYSYTPKMKTV